MSNTAYASRVLSEIHAERKIEARNFAATKAIAEIGIVANLPGIYTISTMNGPRKANWEGVQFESKLAALTSYAREKFGNGMLKKSATGTFLVY